MGTQNTGSTWEPRDEVDASTTPYSPTNTAQYWDPDPTTVGQALDQLVATNIAQSKSATQLGPAASCSIAAPSLSRKRSGNVIIAASMSGTVSGSATVAA